MQLASVSKLLTCSVRDASRRDEEALECSRGREVPSEQRRNVHFGDGCSKMARSVEPAIAP